MTKHYIAITYDICEHDDLCEEMNEYILNPSVNMDEQIKEFASIDVAPLVKVYQSVRSDLKELTFYKQYTFQEYECRCNQ